MNKLLLLIVGVFCFLGSQAQLQNELFSVSQRDFIYWNPATIAIDGRPSVGILYKDVNIGLDNSPLYYAANYQLPIRFQNTAFSATIGKDFLGDLRQNKISLGYRYTLFTHRLDDQKLFIGLSTDFMQNRLMAGNHFARDANDPLVLSENENAYAIDINFGIYYKLFLPSTQSFGDQFISAGVAVNRLRARDAVFIDDAIVATRPRHLYGFLEYEREMGLFNLDARYFISAGGGNVNHSVLVGLKEIYFMSFSLGYSTTKDLIVSWGFDMTNFDDSQLRTDINLLYGLDDVLDKNKNGIQVSVKYLFKPKPWTTSDFR